MPPSAHPELSYDPWQDLATNWPEVTVHISPLPGDLLGLVRYPVIVLRAGSTASQRRCTLAHEIVHLERGVLPWDEWPSSAHRAREELQVERIAASRLMPLRDLARAARELGPGASSTALARALEVDRQLLAARLESLTSDERRAIEVAASDDFAAA